MKTDQTTLITAIQLKSFLNLCFRRSYYIREKNPKICIQNVHCICTVKSRLLRLPPPSASLSFPSPHRFPYPHIHRNKQKEETCNQHSAHPPLFITDSSTTRKTRNPFLLPTTHIVYYIFDINRNPSCKRKKKYSFFSLPMNLCSSECISSHWDWCSKKTWAVPFLVSGADNKRIAPCSQLGFSDFLCKRSSFINLRIQRDGVYLSHREITPVEDEIPSPPDVVDEEATQINPATGFHKDLNSLPSQWQ